MSLYYYCCMNFLKYRKYFFANISVIWFYFSIFLYMIFKNTNFEPYSHNVFPSAKDICAIYVMFSFLIILVFIIFTILEILIRKYLIEKKFSNFKLNIKIKIPKFIEIIYNIIFSIGFISGGVLFCIALLFLFFILLLQ